MGRRQTLTGAFFLVQIVLAISSSREVLGRPSLSSSAVLPARDSETPPVLGSAWLWLVEVSRARIMVTVSVD